MERAVLGIVLLFSLPLFAAEGTAPLISNVGARTTISLDGTWNTIIDPYETGLSSRFFENAKPKSKSDLVEYDFDHSPKLSVPGDWNSQHESLLFYEGPMWYQRYFSYQKREHVRTFLYFGAANYQARVWLNGKKLGEHVGGYTPFDFEVTDVIVEGENSVVVEVDNTRRADGVPSIHTDWWNYGGLTRSVQLIEVPETFIEDYSLQLSRTELKEIAGWVQVNGAKAGTTVWINIPALGVKQSATTDASGRAMLHFPAKPELWSPDKPTLYGVIVTADKDVIKDDIGFRTIETHGTQILLNGKPIFLRGICLHEEAPFRGGRAFSEEDDRTLLTWAKDLGANWFTTFIRVIIPLTLPGIIAGSILVFLPAMTLFYISDILGGAKSILLGNLIQNQFLIAQNWPMGSTFSTVLTMVLATLLLIYVWVTRGNKKRQWL